MRGQIYQWGMQVGIIPMEAANDFDRESSNDGWIVPYVVLCRFDIADDFQPHPNSIVRIAGIGDYFVKTGP